jgi:hypothetical protein
MLLIGALIASVPSVILFVITEISRRAERREYYKQRNIEMAHEFYRKIYDPLAPFLSVSSDIVLALDVIKTKYYEKEIPREILNGLKQFHERMLEVRNTFIQRGYGGLVPRSVRNNIEDLQVHLSMAIGILEKRKEFSKLTPAEKKNIFDKLYRLCEDLQNRIRRLLNVNALDIK